MSPTPSRTRLLLLVAGALVVLGLVVLGAVGLARGHDDQTESHPPETTQGAATSEPPVTNIRVVRVAGSADGVQFARNVAAVLFDWDTTTSAGPDAIVDALVEVGDPSGQETPGLVADVAGYLPTAGQWTRLAEYDTRQRLDVTTAAVPDSWAGILADPVNDLADGMVAVTIDGVRVREGSWFDQATESRAPVAFTVFAACPPAGDEGCRLLRLSGLDTPLR